MREIPPQDSGSHQDQRHGGHHQEGLRGQRDRFVAFAFAGADLLLEIDAGQKVAYAAGITEMLCGCPPRDMLGRPITDFVSLADRCTLTEALRRVADGGRFDSLKISLVGTDSDGRPAMVSGINLKPEMHTTHLAISRLRGATIAAVLDPVILPGQRVETDDFVSLVEQRIKEGECNGEDYSLTLLDLSDARAMPPAQATDFFSNVEGYLRAHSVGGTSVGRLRDDKFGIISDHTLDQEAMQRRISDIAQELDPDGLKPSLRAATVDIAENGMSPQDLTRALVYTINKFVADGDDKMSISTLADGYRAAMDDTLQRVAHFREVIHSDRLMFVYQPIVKLDDWSIHHYEALARIRQNGQIYLPSTFITFAEDVGVVSELDMIVCQRAIEQLSLNTLISSHDRIAINLSGRSIGSSAFLDTLFSLLKQNAGVLPRILFEITESSEMRNLDEANRIVQKLRAMGCQVCLDDFGAGAAAFQYLRALEVDFVKIDGSYIMDAFDTTYGKPFLRAMAALCHDMGIKSIGEMVEDQQSLDLLHEVGVGYAQGFYFSRPQENVTTFSMPPRPIEQAV